MMENSNLPGPDSSSSEKSSNPDEDGRNREWQDRARVNLEEVPDGVHTSVERDFEPENLEEDKNNKKNDHPAY